jgi:hypothetical protein
MPTNELELRRRADISLGELASNGGLLNPDQNDKFYVDLVQNSAFLSSIQTHQMTSNTKKISAFGLQGQVLHAANRTGDRLLAAGKRVDPNFRQPTINAVEFQAEAWLPYEIFENNIEGESFQDTFLTELNKAIRRDIQKIILRSDTASVDDDYNKFDGALKLMSANVSDAASAGISPTVLKSGFLALPEEYRDDRSALGFFTSSAQEVEYASVLSDRQTGLGDSALATNQKRSAAGIFVHGVTGMPEDVIMLTDPRNIAWGLQRNIRVETDRNIKSREIYVVATLVMGVTVVNPKAAAKIINVG